jgi:hypothetical protein
LIYYYTSLNAKQLRAICLHLKTVISGLWLCLFFSLSLVIVGISAKGQVLPAPQQASQGVPTFPWNGTQLPDWNKITVNDFKVYSH